MSRDSLQLISSWEESNKIMEDHIKELEIPGQQLQILEAGCGQRWPLDLTGCNYMLTGIDLDKNALEIRLNSEKDLDKAVVGNLRTAEFDDATFDVIFCSFVLEHISGAERVMSNFRKWLKPGGIIILRVPGPESVQGFVTRSTPHWFHVLYYRRVLKCENAGKAGYAPYPVFYDRVIWRRGMMEYCARCGLNIMSTYGAGYAKSGSGVVKPLISIFKMLMNILSFGYLSHRHTDLLYIIQRPREGL